MALKNRTEARAVVTNWSAILDLETTHKPDLRDNILDNIIFRKDVQGSGSGTGNQTIDFTNYDYIFWDGTGANINITITGIQQGEIKYFFLAKTAFSLLTFVSPAILQAEQDYINKGLGNILFAIYNKNGTDILVVPLTKHIAQGTVSYAGILELASQTEVNAGIDGQRAITPDTLYNCDFLIKTKIIPIGDWNMYGAGSGSYTKVIAHGLTKANIRYVKAIIYDDSNGDVYPLEFSGSGYVRFDATNCTLINFSGSWFDSSSYNLTPLNRGHLLIDYVP
jgi:hypothetical protein